MEKRKKHQITLFHCMNAFNKEASIRINDDVELKMVKMPCSSMTKDVFLLRAFEAGSDAAVVLVCPESQCRHIEGSMRARKRVDRVKTILDEVGYDSDQLSIFNISSGDEIKLNKILKDVVEKLPDYSVDRAAA